MKEKLKVITTEELLTKNTEMTSASWNIEEITELACEIRRLKEEWGDTTLGYGGFRSETP